MARSRVDSYRELLRRIRFAGPWAPTFVEQVGALLGSVEAQDEEEQSALGDIRLLWRQAAWIAKLDQRPSLAPGQCVWLPGHSPGSGGAWDLERQIQVLAALPVPPPAITMRFRVPGFTRKGQRFDMESLGYVVLAAWRHDHAAGGFLEDPYRPTSVWVTMAKAAPGEVGVALCHEYPPEPAPERVVLEFVISKPPAESSSGTVLAELAGASELSASDWLGVDLTFGPEVDIGEFGFYGPIKGLIDAMWPVLGGRPRFPNDHRVHDLRIRQDERTDGSVRARFWYCDS